MNHDYPCDDYRIGNPESCLPCYRHGQAREKNMNATDIVLTGRLKDMLRIIEMHDRHKAYNLRNAATFHALHYAILLGYPCGIGIDPKEPDWPVVYIDLPDVGQVSWHTPGYPGEWDGHSTEQKYERIWAFLGKKL